MRGLAFKRYKKPIIFTVLVVLIASLGFAFFAVSQAQMKNKAPFGVLEGTPPPDFDPQEEARRMAEMTDKLTPEEIEAKLSARDLELFRKGKKEWRFGTYPDGSLVLIEVDGKKVNPDPVELFKLNIKLAEVKLTPKLVERLTEEVEKLKNAGRTITPELVWELYEKVKAELEGAR
jgi:hypothetical protein